MKGRPFLAVVLAVVLLTFSLGVGGWWLIWQRGPLQLAHHALTIPRAARFVPAQAPLSLYLLSDGEQPVAYARAVAPGRQRRNAGEAIERLRDGAFAAAGLDYHDELARWLAPGIALVLFDDPAAEISGAAASGPPSGGWLLALASRDDDGARHFLQRFWQTRSLAGTDLQVSNYRGMGLISGRGALVGSRSVPLATALVDDDLVLIASGRGVLERALDVSQIPELNQASQPGLQRELDQLGEGAALLLARPQALEQWLGWPIGTQYEQNSNSAAHFGLAAAAGARAKAHPAVGGVAARGSVAAAPWPSAAAGSAPGDPGAAHQRGNDQPGGQQGRRHGPQRRNEVRVYGGHGGGLAFRSPAGKCFRRPGIRPRGHRPRRCGQRDPASRPRCPRHPAQPDPASNTCCSRRPRQLWRLATNARHPNRRPAAGPNPQRSSGPGSSAD